MADASLEATATAVMDRMRSGKVPYNAVTGGSVGPGGSGKTQTHRSVMGEPFEGVRNSTVGADKMVLEVRQNKTQTLDLQRVETSSLMERAVRIAAAGKPTASQASIGKMVVSARAAEVSHYVIKLFGVVYFAPVNGRWL
jgi:hypothetical protein